MRSPGRLGSILLVMAAPVALLIGAAPAASAAAAPAIVVDPNPIVPGGSFSFSGSGCVSSVPGQAATVVLSITDGSVIAIKPDKKGHWGVSGTTPLNERVGVYDVTADCDTYNKHFAYAPTTVTVQSAQGAPSVSLSGYGAHPVVEAGGSVTVVGAHLRPGEKVDVVLHSTPIVLASFLADSSGALTGTVTIPADTSLGEHTIELVGQASELTADIGITVVAAAGGTGTGGGTVVVYPPSLAATGVNPAGLIEAGLSLALLGAGALFLARRRVAGQAS